MGWEEKDNKLVRKFEFNDFTEAFAFLTRVAFEAEKAQHHPEIENVYNQVTLSLTTHEDGSKVTEKDRSLAKKIDRLA
ncbi:MAG TPA: 4a-hydroxytetrahydrobiopterin dehydratase [Cryomorphaceae bacterium]|nr:4a-hydroxytetrahydrobiopterin dehydratase [Owenweeksia sp.]MBF97582.1 4a-hydroxytetrahydrobiopterin dehydratase [Owenweeksia sp.]HAD98021.1 4a-hydroxytetrahydrobiopterin dehydratase [Cryomorphaceae bacterium]HBF19843.1 4a-hydroxytetrahydrobiopterin dehydratase [Cryomorphaceae bacterium]|tara:strand:+ start:782 stop:1015 length:234 start_codon:yes stop_codon:yes gene_type:complete